MNDHGEGAISRGPMVPVFEANDAALAARALESLDRAGVPALAADRALGLLVAPVPVGVTVIVVPLGLLREARTALEQTGLRSSSPVASPAVAPVARPELQSSSAGPRVRPTVPVEMRAKFRPLPAADEGEDDLHEAPPFEASSPQTRLTIALGACAVGALLQGTLLSQPGYAALRRTLALSFDGVQFHGNVVTAGFIHGSAAHFLSNLGFGLLLGYVLLGTHGLGATAAVWLTASMVGIAAEAALSAGSVVLGASAGIYGLVGLWLRGELQRASQAVLPKRARLRALGVIVLLAPGALTPITSSGSRVAVLAHLVGFACGLAAGWMFPRWLNADDRRRWRQRGRWAFGAAVAVTASGMIAAFLAV